MITPQLINPQSIVVVGASENIEKPGGKALYNVKNGTFKGDLYAVNPKTDNVQGVKTFKEVGDLPQTDLAILAIPAMLCVPTIKTLLTQKNTKAVIVLSAGFSEMGAEGKRLEKEMVSLCDENQATLIGPNCIGVMNPLHQSVFTTPVPKMEWDGAAFISSSGATAVFIMEAALSKGLTLSSVYSVGNAAQTTVEDVLEYINENYGTEYSSPKQVLMYIESIKKPEKFLKNAKELIKKGCRIAAIKSGTSDAGGRAAASHTGAMLNSDMAVDALFKKAGIIRCNSRGELSAVGGVLQHPRLEGKRIGIITHAGGPAVMLTDVLSNGGLEIPHLEDDVMKPLLDELFEGSSAANPIDILATGTAEQLEKTIQFCDSLDAIDGMAVIFGSPGLFSNSDAYNVILKQQKICKKPIYSIFPSVINAKKEMDDFVAQGGVFFDDEAVLGNALIKETSYIAPEKTTKATLNKTQEIQSLLQGFNGLVPTQKGFEVLDAIGIQHPLSEIVNSEDAAVRSAEKLGFPLVMKVVGPAHKSDVGGVVLNVSTMEDVRNHFNKLNNIPSATGVELCQMERGLEVLIGVKKEAGFGHLITCGLGGIFVEVLKDIQYALAPVSKEEALRMIRSLKSYKMIQGVRGKEGINEEVFADTIVKVSDLLMAAPEIEEMDLNPLMGYGDHLSAVDVVIKI